MNEVSRCQHLTLGGARCTYPSLLNKEFCYDHEHRRFRRRRRRVPILPDPHEVAGPLVTFVYMEDYASILENINNIALAFSENFIDHRQVSSLTYLMNTAVKTVDRMESLQKLRKEDMPRQVAYDDMENPIAPPDSCHPESAPAGEEPGLSESAQPARSASGERSICGCCSQSRVRLGAPPLPRPLLARAAWERTHPKGNLVLPTPNPFLNQSPRNLSSPTTPHRTPNPRPKKPGTHAGPGKRT